MLRQSRLGRRLVIAAAGVLAVIVVLCTGGVAFLAYGDVAPHLARFATSTIGRRVSIKSLEFGWQDGITIELRELAVANAAWSETPELVVVDSASALVDAGALWRGVLRYPRLEISGVRAVLERGPDGVGNWELAGDVPAVPPGEEVVPENRTQFPTLLDAVLKDALVTYRTSSGAVLKLDLDEVTVRAAADDQPIAVAATGAYNGVATRLTATMESFDALRDGSRPYGLAYTAETATTTATFEGTLRRVLDFDDVDGRLAVEAGDTADLGKMFRAEIGISFPLDIAGRMARTGNDWRLSGAEGAVAGNSFAGDLRLVEAGRGQPDDVTADLDFAQFDIGTVLGKAADGGGVLEAPLSSVEPIGINVDADLHAGSFIHGTTRLSDAALVGRVAGRQITVDTLAFALAGGQVTASGSSEPAGAGGQVKLDAALADIDASEVAGLLGAAPGEFAGTLDGRAALDMTGATVREALATSRGHAVLVMDQGRIARAILELAATDLRSLFRTSEGSARIRCLLGVLNLENGVGQVPIVKLRTSDATLEGGGTVDLAKQRVDMTFTTRRDSTGFFALDIPFRVRGRLENPSIEPAFDGGSHLSQGAIQQLASQLPADLGKLVENNACRT